jgi:glycosyltransferase involved in cell wall biosynthesis
MKDTKNKPLVSIITPVYNGAAFIEQLILSVKSQDYPNIEHIIIDDGSQDDEATVSILRRYPHLKWWSHKNQGQYATMNDGLKKAKGDFICFICADDFMKESAVRQASDWLIHHPDFDGVYGLASYINENGDPYPVRYPFRRAPLWYYPYFSQLAHCSLYISRQTLLDNNLWFEPEIQFVGDYDWILRMLNAGIRIGFIDSTFSTVRIHKNQISSQNRPLMAINKREIADRNGYGGFRYIFLTSILHGLNFAEQVRVAFKENKFAGVRDVFDDWIYNRILPRFNHKP